MRKNKWATPVLTVLVRGKREEAVLLACKGTGLGGLTNVYAWCMITPPSSCPVPCNASGTS